IARWTASGRSSGAGRRAGRRASTRAPAAASPPARLRTGAPVSISGCRAAGSEGTDGLVLGVVDVKDLDELGDVEDVPHLGVQVDELQLGTPVLDRGVRAHQLSDAG